MYSMVCGSSYSGDVHCAMHCTQPLAGLGTQVSLDRNVANYMDAFFHVCLCDLRIISVKPKLV